MYCLKSTTTNPYFNIAAEEFLLKNHSDDFLFLYRNEPCIIIGKHQIPYVEIDYSFFRKLNIPLIRRLSGGGTVYHDLGNINFSFILNGSPGKLVDFSKYVTHIQSALKKIDIETITNARNNIFINNKKISGNAEHIYKNRVLHHGTLLFNSNLENLQKCLKINSEKYNHKAIVSVPSVVTNISEILKEKISNEDFMTVFYKNLCSDFENITTYNFSDNECNEIEKLIDEKYSKWEWNFGYSPAYSFLSEVNSFKLSFDVKNGVITNFFIDNNSFDYSKLTNALNNCRHSENEICAILEKNKVSEDVRNLILQNIF